MTLDLPFAKPFAVRPGSPVDLSKHDPDDTHGENEAGALPITERNVQRIAELQEILTAEASQALLIVLQAMDTGGKDPTIREVMWATNPSHCQARNFKKPSKEEAAHDYLWRFHPHVPALGDIGIFNRSYFEEVISARVNETATPEQWTRRYDQINDFERYLTANRIFVLKFFFYISKDEQRRRLQERIDRPEKQWELSESDFEARRKWDDYMRAFEDALSRCSTTHAPWHIIPANRDWFRNRVVSQIIVDALERMDPQYPPPSVDLSQVTLD